MSLGSPEDRRCVYNGYIRFGLWDFSLLDVFLCYPVLGKVRTISYSLRRITWILSSVSGTWESYGAFECQRRAATPCRHSFHSGPVALGTGPSPGRGAPIIHGESLKKLRVRSLNSHVVKRFELSRGVHRFCGDDWLGSKPRRCRHG